MIRMALNTLIIALIGVMSFITFKIMGPMVELRYIKPVQSLEFTQFECADDDVIIRGMLDKTFYVNEQEAEFIDMVFYNTDTLGKRLPYRRVDPTDLSPENRKAGVQPIEVILVGGCDKTFIARTRHISPITGLVLRMTFGPFEGQDNTEKENTDAR